jgi:hypothetical protein
MSEERSATCNTLQRRRGEVDVEERIADGGTKCNSYIIDIAGIFDGCVLHFAGWLGWRKTDERCPMRVMEAKKTKVQLQLQR